MTMDPQRILRDFDRHASEFNFPFLDNACVQYAASRMTAFRSPTDWLIILEVLGFSTQEVAIVDDVYAYGSCVDKQGFAGEELPISSPPEQPMFDANTNESLLDWSRLYVTIKGRPILLSPSLEEYAKAGVIINRDPGPRSLTEIELLRFLIHCVGEKSLFLCDDELIKRFPRCAGLTKFLQTTRWQHPDVADGEMPSKNISIRTMVEALAEQNPSLFDPGIPNTCWKHWLEQQSS